MLEQGSVVVRQRIETKLVVRIYRHSLEMHLVDSLGMSVD